MFSTDTELSSSLINKVYQDHKGYIWMATEDGLDRYDGAKFTIYKQKREDSTSILNNYVKSIFEDSDNQLYFGFFNGLQVYDHATDSFQQIPLLIENNTPYHAHVTSFLERTNGEILIGTSGHGVFLLNKDKSHPRANKLPELVSSSFITDLYEDRKGNLWVLSQDRGLFRINPDGETKRFFSSGNYDATSLSSICEDHLGNLYVGSLTHGLHIYKEEKETFQPLKSGFNLPIKTLHLTEENKILIGTDGIGLRLYDPVDNKISISDFSISNFDFSKSKVHSILEDKAGNLWLGLYQKGMMLIPAKINNFNYIGFQSVKNNIIGSNSVSSVFKSEDDMLWVGTDGDGLYGISPNLRKKYHVTDKDRTTNGSTTIMSIFEDSNGEIWVGTYLAGLAKLNRDSHEIEYEEGMLDENSNPVEPVFSIIEDEEKRLWFGTMGSGLFSFDLETREFSSYNSFPNNSDPFDFLHNRWINCILLSKSNKIYIGTFDGLSTLDLENNTYINEDGVNHIMGGKIVYSLHEDKAGNLWMGTSDGLFLKSKEKEEFVTYTTKDGLPSNVISSIEEDKNNNLWISTNHGIAKFDPDSNNFINYYFKDGLQGNEFSKNASYSGKDDYLFFGSTNGVTYFNPDEITTQGKDIDLRITGFYIQDEPVKKGMKSGKYDIVDKAVIEADSFNLAHNDNDFSIEFSSMEFNNPERITYSYSMNGENWIKLRPGINNVTFNNLEPSDYTFRVRARDYGEFSNEQELAITIHPPWYFSNWAKLSYVLIFIAIGYFVVQEIRQRQKTRKKLQEHLHAKQINEAKLQFLTNISHDLKTPISLIINPLKKLIKNDQNEDRQKSYRVMERNSERIIYLVDQLIDARKLDKGQISLKFQKTEIISFTEEICALFEDQIKEKGVRFKITHNMDSLHAWIDPRHFDKIIQNVVSNAIKFTPEKGRIEVLLKQNKSHFQIIVNDDGIGLAQNELERVFDRFYQASGNKTDQSEGTGIGLHLTRSIAELHHGTIRAENNGDNRGCRFIINIPLGKEHLNEEEIIPETDIADTKPQTNTAATSLPLPKEEPVEVAANSKPKVLVIDDDREIRNYLSQELSHHYNIICCSNGKVAFPVVLKENPDLIISDISMPEMDGKTFCRKVKKNININHIPVILLTGRSDERNNVEGLDIGADAYMLKPFNMEILKKTARNLIRNRELLKNTYSGNQAQDQKVQKVKIISADEKLLQKFMEVVGENINKSDLNVEMIANELGISRVHLYRKLKQLTNQSARELIQNIRLKQAGELLASKKINVSEVAYAVGFSSTSKFSTKFKEFYGDCPKDYRERHLEMETADKN